MLKNVLSLLLSRFYSKQESELVGHQAMPSPSNTVITPSIKTECTTWSDAHVGIAPADGYLYVTGRTTNTDGFLQISSDTTEIAATTFGNTDKDIRLLFPLAKGQAMKVTAKSLKSIYLRFSSSIGGGYQTLKKLILQGGGLCCLKHSYSSLRRSSWLARRSGWLISRLIFLRPLQKLPSLLTENATPSQCLTRASWFCNVTASCLQDLTDLTWSISEREQTATSAFLFIPRKATLFLTRLANPTTSEPQTCTSIRLTVANNLSIGGASC